MTLYHGSNMAFKTPLLSKCSPHKDFGRGFYLSDSYDVASRTALRAVRQHGGEAKVMVFEVDDKLLQKLNYKCFSQPGNRAWAKFVLANRNPGMKAEDHNRDRRYDWVVGPIADDGSGLVRCDLAQAFADRGDGGSLQVVVFQETARSRNGSLSRIKSVSAKTISKGEPSGRGGVTRPSARAASHLLACGGFWSNKAPPLVNSQPAR